MALIVPPVTDLKTRALRRADGETTMFSTLVAMRDERVLVAVSTPRMEATLACAHTLAVGISPQLLCVAAQVSLPDGAEGIAYTTMTTDHVAALAVQPYTVAEGEIAFGIPKRGEVKDRSVMDELARALNHPPLDAAKVATRGAEGNADAEPDFIPPEQGRLVIDSGTCASLQRSIEGIGGTVVYIPASAEHAGSLLTHGMPQQVLVG